MQSKFWWEHLDAFLSPFVVTDHKGHILYANESFLNLFALTPKVIRKQESLAAILFFEDGAPFDVTSPTVFNDRYNEVRLNNKRDEFTLQYRVIEAKDQFGRNGEAVYVFAFHDVSLEITLQKKHRRQLEANQNLISRLEQNVAENNLFLEMADIDTDRLNPTEILKTVEEAGQRLLGWQSFHSTVCEEAHTHVQNLLQVFCGNRIGSKIRFGLSGLQAAYEADVKKLYWTSGELGLLKVPTQNQQALWILVQTPQERVSAPAFFQALQTRISEVLKKHYLNLSSITDALTGVYNRGYFDREFDRLIDGAKKNSEPLTLLIVDADHFKSVNDRFGHPVGDKVLVQISQVLKAYSRGSDLVARLGGEEFGVVLFATSVKDSQIVAERIRQKIEQTTIDISDTPGLPHIGLAAQTVKVTVSMGLAELSERYPNAKAIYAAADQALYDAKHSGRNQLKSAA